MRTKKKQEWAPETLSLFCEQLSLLLQAGIGTEEAVNLLCSEENGPSAGTGPLTRLGEALAAGAPLAQGLAWIDAFPDYMVRMVEIGQVSGRLDQVLAALGVYYRREAQTASAVRRAVLYPAVMAVLVAVVFLVLVARVLPVFQNVFNQLGVSLSPVAQALLHAGTAGKYVGAALVSLLALGALALLFRTFRPGASRAFLGRGKAGKALDRSRFAAAMALMLSSGLPLDESMERTVRLLEGAPLSPALKDCQSRMAQGENFPKAVAETGILDGMQAGLLSAGFRAGLPERAMEELAARSQEESGQLLENMLSKLEFALVILLCVSVGLVLLSVMLPLLGVLSALG